MRTAAAIGLAALIVAFAGCAQNTAQPVSPAAGQGVAQELPQDTSNRDWFVFNVNGGIAAEDLAALVSNPQLATRRALAADAGGSPTSQPVKLAWTDELGAGVEIEAADGKRVQQINFVMNAQADSQQGGTQTMDQATDAAIEATQEIKTAIEIMLDLQVQWTNTLKVLSELADSMKDLLKASLVPDVPTPVE